MLHIHGSMTHHAAPKHSLVHCTSAHQYGAPWWHGGIHSMVHHGGMQSMVAPAWWDGTTVRQQPKFQARETVTGSSADGRRHLQNSGKPSDVIYMNLLQILSLMSSPYSEKEALNGKLDMPC